MLALEVHAPDTAGGAARLALSYYAAPRGGAGGAGGGSGAGGAGGAGGVNASAAWREVRLPCPRGACFLPDDLPALLAAALPNATAWCTACRATTQLPACAAATAAAAAAAAAAASERALCAERGGGKQGGAISPWGIAAIATGPSLLLLAFALLAARGLHNRCVAHRRAASGRAVGCVSSTNARPPNGTRAVVREFTDVQLSDAATGHPT